MRLHRPALLAGMQPAIEDEERLRQTWLMQHSLTLPAKVGSILHHSISKKTMQAASLLRAVKTDIKF